MSWNDDTAARTIWQEARNQGVIGMKAVAHVIRNRVADGRWGKVAAEACLWPLQFSGWRPSDPNYGASCRLSEDDPILQTCLNAWVASESEPDPTEGACFYHTVNMNPPPSWARAMHETVVIGAHIFYRDRA